MKGKVNFIILLSSVSGEKLNFVCGVSKDLLSRYKAGDLIKQVAALTGGSGGGRPEMAQAGGTDLSKLDAAQELFYSLI
jgi:alanyl-tRNA synthetase